MLKKLRPLINIEFPVLGHEVKPTVIAPESTRPKQVELSRLVTIGERIGGAADCRQVSVGPLSLSPPFVRSIFTGRVLPPVTAFASNLQLDIPPVSPAVTINGLMEPSGQIELARSGPLHEATLHTNEILRFGIPEVGQ